MIDEAIRKLLVDDAAVYAVVGERVFNVMIPLGTQLPCIAFRLMGLEEFSTHGGVSKTVSVQYQIGLFGDNQLVLHNLAKEVRRVFNSFRGIKEGVNIGFCKVLTQMDAGDEVASFHVPVDVVLMFREV